MKKLRIRNESNNLFLACEVAYTYVMKRKFVLTAKNISFPQQEGMS